MPVGKPATLAVKITGDADDAVSSFDKVTAAARDMGDTVDHASKQADTGAGRLDRATESADNLGSKSGELTGAIGALSSGFALVGAEKYAAQLESAAMATDFLSGVGDLARLALESQALATLRARAASVAHSVASKAQAAATYGVAVAQRAVNLAMRANPIGVVITLVLAIVGALVLAYRHSDRFRAIVDKAGQVARAAFRTVVGAVSDVVGWLRNKLGPAISTAAAVFTAISTKGRAAFDAVRDKVSAVVGAIVDKASSIRDRFANVWEQVRSTASAAFDRITGPIQAIIDKVQGVYDLIRNIPTPHIPGIGRVTGALGGLVGRQVATGPQLGSDLGGGSVNVTVNVHGFVGSNPQLADAIADALYARARRLGIPLGRGNGLVRA